MVARTFGFSHADMLSMSVRLMRAYHDQIDRIRAAEELGLAVAARSAQFTPDSWREHIETLRRRSRGEVGKLRVISDPAELSAFLKR